MIRDKLGCMSRFAGRVVLLLLSGATLISAHGQGLCNALTEVQVRVLTGVPTGGFSRRLVPVANGALRCVYGVTNGDLVLDAYHMDTDANAIAMIGKLGTVTNSSNFTTSPYGTDQVDTLTSWQRGPSSNPFYDLTGFVARHGNLVVSIGLDKPDTDRTPAGQARLQAAVLELAGAQVAPWPLVDVCLRVPAASVQTLVALGPAKLVSSAHKSQGGNSDCTYIFHPINGEGDEKVVLKSERWINDLEALAYDKSKPAPLPFNTSDPTDTALTVAEPGFMAAALHKGELGRVDIYSPGRKAENDDSIRTHLAEAAFMAAGGTITGGPGLQGIPAPVQPNALSSAGWSVVNALRDYWFLWLVLALTAYIFWRRHLRQQILRTGIPGIAVVDSIPETGITINNNPVIKLHLTITPEGRDSFTATQNKTVSPLETPASWIGRRLNARIDRQHPSSFMLLP